MRENRRAASLYERCCQGSIMPLQRDVWHAQSAVAMRGATLSTEGNCGPVLGVFFNKPL